MNQLIEISGRVYGPAAAILAQLPAVAKVTAARLRDWVRRGLLHVVHVGRANWYAFEEVLEVELRTRVTAARRGGARRGCRTAVRTP